MTVYPNLASTQRALIRRSQRHLDDEHVCLFPSVIDWPDDPLERDPEQRSSAENTLARNPRELPHVRCRSSVLIYGNGQSGKGPFWLNFVAEQTKLMRYRDWSLGATGGVHIVSFRGDEQETLRPLRECPELSNRWTRNVSDVQFKWYGVDDAMTAAQVTYDLLQRIQRSRQERLPLEWIVFLGVEAIPRNLPTVAAERSFWPTILATTASEEITTLFVVDDVKASFVAQHALDMDYVFRFERSDLTRWIYTEKSPEPPPREGYPRLQLSLPAHRLGYE